MRRNVHSGTLKVRVAPVLLDNVKAAAAREGMSPSEWMRHAIRLGLGTRPAHGASGGR